MRHVVHAPPAASVNVNLGATIASFPFHSVLLTVQNMMVDIVQGGCAYETCWCIGHGCTLHRHVDPLHVARRRHISLHCSRMLPQKAPSYDCQKGIAFVPLLFLFQFVALTAQKCPDSSLLNAPP